MNPLEEGSTPTLAWAKRGGLLPVVVQDADTGQVLMLGYANEEALAHTQETRLATFYSTSRQQLWTKGETSGDALAIEEILVDCDQDALLYRVTPQGDGACHTQNASGHTRSSCFYRRLDGQPGQATLFHLDP